MFHDEIAVSVGRDTRHVGERVQCPLGGLRGGQRALEGGPVGRPAVRRKHLLDRQCE
jgi:hypothetical protein